MTWRNWAALGACLVACLSCVAAGRLTAPRPAPRVLTVEREVVRYYEAQTWRLAEQRATTEKRDVRVVTRWTPAPGCTGQQVVERVEEDRSTRAENVATTKEGAKWVQSEAKSESRTETKAAPSPRWHVAAGPALSFGRQASGEVGFSALRTGLSLSTSARIAGPLWLTALAARAGGATTVSAMVGVQW